MMNKKEKIEKISDSDYLVCLKALICRRIGVVKQTHKIKLLKKLVREVKSAR